MQYGERPLRVDSGRSAESWLAKRAIGGRSRLSTHFTTDGRLSSCVLWAIRSPSAPVLPRSPLPCRLGSFGCPPSITDMSHQRCYPRDTRNDLLQSPRERQTLMAPPL